MRALPDRCSGLSAVVGSLRCREKPWLPSGRCNLLARPFKSEMTELLGTLEWVGSADLSEVVAGLARARYQPIVAVGSGGSLSAAQHLARLHRTFRRRLSVAMTPYQFRSEPTPADAHCWVFSAGGSNVDVLAAVSAAIRAEARAFFGLDPDRPR